MMSVPIVLGAVLGGQMQSMGDVRIKLLIQSVQFVLDVQLQQP